MNIVFASDTDLAQLQIKYIVLELDTLRFENSNQTQTAWCLISTENLTLQELPLVDQYRQLHNNMMRNYKLKNWKYCEDAIEYLMGRWRGELDSFYVEISNRLVSFKKIQPDTDWDGSYVKS